MGLEKTLKTSGFGQPTPLIKGVNLHLLNKGGMGCQGRSLGLFFLGDNSIGVFPLFLLLAITAFGASKLEVLLAVSALRS